MFAPQAKLSFSDALLKCRDNSISVCLMYGKEDPWVTLYGDIKLSASSQMLHTTRSAQLVIALMMKFLRSSIIYCEDG
ncbi:unnamed protein product [Rhodiola kirilowii]